MAPFRGASVYTQAALSQPVGKGCLQTNRPFPSASGRKGWLKLRALCTITFPRRLYSVPAEGGYPGLNVDRVSATFLQLRDSAGLGPASPLGPVTSERWGTSAAALFDCVATIPYLRQASKLESRVDRHFDWSEVVVCVGEDAAKPRAGLDRGEDVGIIRHT